MGLCKLLKVVGGTLCVVSIAGTLILGAMGCAKPSDNHNENTIENISWVETYFKDNVLRLTEENKSTNYVPSIEGKLIIEGREVPDENYLALVELTYNNVSNEKVKEEVLVVPNNFNAGKGFSVPFDTRNFKTYVDSNGNNEFDVGEKLHLSENDLESLVEKGFVPEKDEYKLKIGSDGQVLSTTNISAIPFTEDYIFGGPNKSKLYVDFGEKGGIYEVDVTKVEDKEKNKVVYIISRGSILTQEHNGLISIPKDENGNPLAYISYIKDEGGPKIKVSVILEEMYTVSQPFPENSAQSYVPLRSNGKVSAPGGYAA